MTKVWFLILAFLMVTLPLKRVWALQTADRTVEYSLLITGNELLSGVYPDGHTHYITRTLKPLGFRCVVALIVDDTPKALADALSFASEAAGLILVTGGLGPTPDDITRDVISRHTGIPLEQHPEVLKELEKRYSRSLITRPNVLRQARVPVQGGYLKNSRGTAVGLIFDKDERVVIAMPGPPQELHLMVDEQLLPYLAERFGTRILASELTLRLVGIGESAITQILDERVDVPADVIVSSLFDRGRVDLTFKLPGDPDRGRLRLEQLKKGLSKHLGQYLYSDQGTSLEETVLSLLSLNGLSLTTAEVGTGGHLIAALSIADNTSVLRGGYVAGANGALTDLLGSSKKSSQSSLPVYERTRELSQRLAGSGWAVVTSDRFEESNGSHSLWVVVASSQQEIASRKLSWTRERGLRYGHLVTQVLDLLRRSLLERKEP